MLPKALSRAWGVRTWLYSKADFEKAPEKSPRSSEELLLMLGSGGIFFWFIGFAEVGLHHSPEDKEAMPQDWVHVSHAKDGFRRQEHGRGKFIRGHQEILGHLIEEDAQLPRSARGVVCDTGEALIEDTFCFQRGHWILGY